MPVVLAVLLEVEGPLGPTAIGQKLGFDYVQASSRVMPALRRLVEACLVRRLPGGRYEAVREG